MYTDGSQAAGHHRFIQHLNTAGPCSCQHCVHREQPAYGHRGGPGFRPAPARRTDHPSPGCGRDAPAPRAKDAGARAYVADGGGRSGHRSPQRRPVFAGPDPRSQSDDLRRACPWDLNPAQWSHPPEPGARHCPSVREQCGCVARGDTRAHPFNAGIPHPLPHLQVRGQGYRHRRTVTVEEEGEECGCNFEGYRSEPRDPHLGRTHAPNGHCGPRTGFFEGGEETDSHQARGRLEGGSDEGCNGGGGSHKGFFPTEVPQKHLKQREKGPRVTHSGISSPTTNGDHQSQVSDVAKQKRRQDLVRDKIRQVVTDLEDVLGGLKQVHVEMKEVVQQIDRLTARIDLSEETSCITHAGESINFHGSAHPDDLTAAQQPDHKPAPVRATQHIVEDRIILRTNSPSPVHVASVVKTSRFTPPSIAKAVNHERTGANGHAPHLHRLRDSNHVGQAHPEPHPHSLEPKVIIGNSTSGSRTQKPPLYPQNGRCGKGPYLPPKPVRTPACPARGCQSASNV
ncbi:uncharacterized protein LOC120816440 [Gasterosteus aculeatus]